MNDPDAPISIRPVGRAGDLGWVVMAHGEVYAAEFGWDGTFEALVARIVADYATEHDPRREAGWIADVAGRRVGCIFCMADPDCHSTAKLRILLVHPDGRGQGIGRRLLDASLAFAQMAGYDRARLWTNHPLTAARRIYLQRGFCLVEEEAHRSFGVDLIGQVYELDLRAGPSSRAHEGTTRGSDRCGV
jgi:GNAT superfamily N-acetyltransferase